jgi:hypothetical protein
MVAADAIIAGWFNPDGSVNKLAEHRVRYLPGKQQERVWAAVDTKPPRR